MSGELVALNSNWLDDIVSPTIGGSFGSTTIGVVANSAFGYCIAAPYWPSPYPSWTITTTSEHKPIKLGYSEIERLRAAARRDAKLKKILQKFTDMIEVVVDFE